MTIALCFACKEGEFNPDPRYRGKEFFQYVKRGVILHFCSRKCQLLYVSLFYPDTAKFILERLLGHKPIVSFTNNKLSFYYLFKYSIRHERVRDEIIRLYEEWEDKPKGLDVNTILLVFRRIKFFSEVKGEFCLDSKHNRRLLFEYPNGEVGAFCLDCEKVQREFWSFSLDEIVSLDDHSKFMNTRSLISNQLYGGEK